MLEILDMTLKGMIDEGCSLDGVMLHSTMQRVQAQSVSWKRQISASSVIMHKSFVSPFQNQFIRMHEQIKSEDWL